MAGPRRALPRSRPNEASLYPFGSRAAPAEQARTGPRQPEMDHGRKTRRHGGQLRLPVDMHPRQGRAHSFRSDRARVDRRRASPITRRLGARRRRANAGRREGVRTGRGGPAGGRRDRRRRPRRGAGGARTRAAARPSRCPATTTTGRWLPSGPAQASSFGRARRSRSRPRAASAIPRASWWDRAASPTGLSLTSTTWSRAPPTPASSVSSATVSRSSSAARLIRRGRWG